MLVACNAVLLRALDHHKVDLSSRKAEFSLMTNKSTERSMPISNLQRSFEAAVQDVYQVSLTGKSSRYRSPIARRPSATAPESYLTAEKRALSDAAKALAQLWRVAPSSSR